MLLAPTLIVLVGLTQANVNQNENGVAPNAANLTTFQVASALTQIVDRVKRELGLLGLRLELLRLERESEQQEKDFRRLQQDFYRQQKRIDFPREPDILPNRLPSGHRRV